MHGSSSSNQRRRHTGAKANRYNYAVAFFVALGSFTYGFNSSVIGAVLGQPSFYNYFGFEATSSLGGSITGATNGLYAGAGVIGCLTVFNLLDALGRKRAIQVAAIGCLITGALQAGSVHIAMYLVGRFFNGLTVGWINCCVPVYISEISPAGERGRIVGAHGFIICVGYGLSGWCGLGTFYESNGTIQWRLLLALQCVAPLLLTLGSPWIPESPRYLINKGRDNEGLQVIEKLHANGSDGPNIGAREEFIQIQTQLALDRMQNVNSWWQIMKVPTYRKRIFYGFWLQCTTQSTGVLVLTNYMGFCVDQIIELQVLGITGAKALILLASYNTLAAITNGINSLIVDRVGRIKMLVTCLIACTISLILVTALVAQYGGYENTNKTGSAMILLFMFCFATFYGGGLDVSAYVYCSEIFPTNIRARGVGLSVAGLFLMTTIYTSAAGTAFNHIGWRYYIVFIVITSCMLPLIIFKFPETKGLSLEEIGALFGDEVALDISHLSDEDRRALDARLARTLDIEHFDTAVKGPSTQEIEEKGASID
ncbi:hypothetical protein AYL99_06500 [Fonsecaea erecta]|uniref:Major facilitator superfamily (MFS) profile domain-containing protein n=1 Tax=Fonsecaea erecta TaxID=1367422 RepID=A0A178ZHT3_9EURO|nr:hypothetical protein AYL99_06500 [Fonsecaea erecta]OAP59202.1 hypothetical protein AYL99_06500 [Fonsecaea erecta]